MLQKDVTELVNTFHGEFPTPGHLMTLIRFRYCNLDCKFCDTEEKMQPEYPSVSLNEDELYLKIYEMVKTTNSIMFTGGEPGLYINEIAKILNRLFADDVYIENVQIETNGLFIDNFYQFYNNLDYSVKYAINEIFSIVWSPKFINQQETLANFNRLYSKNVSRLLNDFIYIKVIGFPEWLNTIDNFLKVGSDLYGRAFRKRFAIMYPTNFNTVTGKHEYDIELVSKLLEYCLDRGINFSPRIHLVFDIK